MPIYMKYFGSGKTTYTLNVANVKCWNLFIPSMFKK